MREVTCHTASTLPFNGFTLTMIDGFSRERHDWAEWFWWCAGLGELLV